MPTVTMSDVLAASYASVERAPAMTQANTALLLLDIQELATPEHLAEKAVNAGLETTEVACAAYEAAAHDAFTGKYASWGLTRSTQWLRKKLARLK